MGVDKGVGVVCSALGVAAGAGASGVGLPAADRPAFGEAVAATPGAGVVAWAMSGVLGRGPARARARSDAAITSMRVLSFVRRAAGIRRER